MTPTTDWMRLTNPDETLSPSLLIFPDRVAENLRRMIALAGGVERLRPHVKTHKLPQIVALKLAHGIRKFKTSTIAESEMCAVAGAPDVMLAYQPVGPNVRRIIELVRKFPGTRFSCIADNLATVSALSSAAVAAGVTLDVWIDLNVGMNRTGIVPGPEAFAVYRAIAQAPGLRPAGLHVYDGHLIAQDKDQRRRDSVAATAPAFRLRDELLAAGLPVPAIVGGGTPTLAIHAQNAGVELGAGTTVLWDVSDAQKSPHYDFLHAAVLFMRVISHPAPNHICIDLGHKSVASERPHPRVKLFGIDDAEFVNHSEEHLVVKTARAAEFPVGTPVYGIPFHICPTVALQSEVYAVRDGRVFGTWPVVARARRLTV